MYYVEEMISEVTDSVICHAGEGIIMQQYGSNYEQGRTKTLVKLKVSTSFVFCFVFILLPLFILVSFGFFNFGYTGNSRRARGDSGGSQPRGHRAKNVFSPSLPFTSLFHFFLTI